MSLLPEKLFDLSGRVAIVTGASRGIGATISDTLAQSGAKVIGVARSDQPDEVPADGVEYFSCDINNHSAFRNICKKVFEIEKRLDILVNNAGIFLPIKREADRLKSFSGMLESNLTAAYACSIAAADHMIKAGNGGSIINITSIGGVVGFAGMPGYAASKGGLGHLSVGMAMDLGNHNIRINNIAPGYIITDMNRNTLTEDVSGRNRRLARLMLKRHGETWEVAAAALFLASDAGSYLTGDTLHVDGGWSMQGMTYP